MKNYFRLAALCTIAMLMMISCSKDDGNTTPEDDSLAEYTIICYGSSGGNLDYDADLNFDQIESMGYQENVQYTGIYKYSSTYQEKGGEYEGTRLMTMETNGELSNVKFADADFRLDDPQNLADFIIDAKLRLPAKKYILVIRNHGQGFDIRDQLVESSYATTKGFLVDDNTDSRMSIFELEAALELVGEKMDMLYWNACLMNAIEANYQIHEYFDYIMGSNHASYTPSYATLINAFVKYDDVVEAGKYYAEKTTAIWKEYNLSASCDLTLIECSKIEKVVGLIADVCDVLCDYRDSLEEGSYEYYEYRFCNGNSSDNAKAYYFSDAYNEEDPAYFYTSGGMSYYYYDIGGYDQADLSPLLGMFCYISCSGELSTLASLLTDAVDDMYLCREYVNLSSRLSDVTVSLNMVSDVAYNYTHPEDYEIKTLAELYPHLDFDKATGWGSKFLSGNAMQAIGYDAATNTYYPIER